MTHALQALLDGIIDYAGLFPPAKHPMDIALDEYFAHLNAEEEFLVNRFACTTSRLQELSGALKQCREFNQGNDVFEITAIGSVPEKDKDVYKEDIELMKAFQLEGAAISSYEAKAEAGGVGPVIRATKSISQEMDIYIEVPFSAKFEDDLNTITTSEFAFAKARTGGVNPNSHPTPEVLARFIREVVDLDLPFKLTGGLHHPMPTLDTLSGDTMHGFLNVAMAISLAMTADLSRGEIARILQVTDPTQFKFTEEFLGLYDYQIGLEDIESVRSLWDGFGSCSVTEPMEDLEKLGLW